MVYIIEAIVLANDDVGYVRELLGRMTAEDSEMLRLVGMFADLLKRAIDPEVE